MPLNPMGKLLLTLMEFGLNLGCIGHTHTPTSPVHTVFSPHYPLREFNIVLQTEKESSNSKFWENILADVYATPVNNAFAISTEDYVSDRSFKVQENFIKHGYTKCQFFCTIGTLRRKEAMTVTLDY